MPSGGTDHGKRQVALNENARAALYMVAAMAGFVLSDTVTKIATATINPGQIMFVRGVFATVLLALMAWRANALQPALLRLDKFVALRIVTEMAATITFLSAIAFLPLANISAILQALPLAITVGAAIVFRDRVGWRRWTAIAVGFTGVLIVVRPGVQGFNEYSVLALISVLFCVVRDLATRKVPRSIPTLFVSTLTSLAVCLMGLATVMPMGGWTPMPGRLVLELFGGAVMLVIGYQCVIAAMRIGDISFVAPFRYTSLPWAILLGLVVFGDIPDFATLLGACIIIGSGLYMLYRERKLQRSTPVIQSTGPGMAPDGA